MSMIIGISGCSNSGKSGLAKILAEYYSSTKKVEVLCQDDFVKRRDYLSKINDHVNWELPSTIKIEEFLNAVLIADKQNNLVICEGLFAFWFDELNILYNKKIFIEIDKAAFKQRKQVDLRWGKEPDWYIEHIWESHLKYGQCNLPVSDCLFLDASDKINIKKAVEFISL